MTYSLKKFNRRWRVTVDVIDDGGADRYGRYGEEAVTQVKDCLVGPSSTKDLQDYSDKPRAAYMLYGPPMMKVKSSFMIRVPAGHWCAGVYNVNGEPGQWPLGTTVPLAWVRPLSAEEGGDG